MATYEAIASTTLTTSTAAITFDAIPDTYDHLQLRAYAIAIGVTNTSGYVRFNNRSSTGDYWEHYLEGRGSTTAAGSSISNNLYIGRFAGDSYTTTGGVAIVDILDYTSTNKLKTTRVINGWDASGAGRVAFTGGLYAYETAPITRIDFSLATNMKAETVVALYGLRSS